MNKEGIGWRVVASVVALVVVPGFIEAVVYANTQKNGARAQLSDHVQQQAWINWLGHNGVVVAIAVLLLVWLVIWIDVIYRYLCSGREE